MSASMSTALFSTAWTFLLVLMVCLGLSRICCDRLLNRLPSSIGPWNFQLMGKTAIDLGVPLPGFRFFIACYIFYRLHIMH